MKEKKIKKKKERKEKKMKEIKWGRIDQFIQIVKSIFIV